VGWGLRKIYTPEFYFQGRNEISVFRKIELENDESARDLQVAVERGEYILAQIHAALHDIATKQIEMGHLS